MHSFDVFHHYERNHWQLRDIDAVGHALVEPEYVMLAQSAVMGECNSLAAIHGFFNEFVDDYDFSVFVAIWGYQELQHHYAFKTWLRVVDQTRNNLLLNDDTKDLTQALRQHRTKGSPTHAPVSHHRADTRHRHRDRRGRGERTGRGTHPTHLGVELG